MPNKIKGKFLQIYTNTVKEIRAWFNRCRLKNKDFSIISKNCIGGVISENLHLPFRSPTAGISINTPDFIKLCENLEYYMSLTPVEIIDESVKWPVGLVGDVRLDFMHCPDFETAVQKWERRKVRINYDNLFFIMLERPDSTEEHLKRFESLPYKNKVWFTHLPREKEVCHYIPGYEKEGFGNVIDNKGLLKKYIFESNFDYVKWLNKK